MLLPPVMPPSQASTFARWSVLRRHVVGQASKQNGKPCVPLVPVVASPNSVKLEVEMTLSEQLSKFALCRQQTLLVGHMSEKGAERLPGSRSALKQKGRCRDASDFRMAQKSHHNDATAPGA